MHKKVALYTIGVVSLWAVAGIIVLAARCGATFPWNITSTNQCINLRTFWIGMAPVDVLSELVIIVIPILMMIPVQVAVSKKAVIVVAFSFRALVIAATIARLFYIIPIYPARNFTFDTVNAEVMNQIVLSFSITTACIPCLKPFLDAFDSGRMAVMVDSSGRIGGSHSESKSYPLRDLSYVKNLGYGNNKSMVTSGIDRRGDDRDMDINEAVRYGPNGRRQPSQTRGGNGAIPNSGTAYPINEKEEISATDNGSVASSSKSDQMIIKKNVSYTVQYEDSNPTHEEKHPPRSHASSTRQSKQDLHKQFVFHDPDESQQAPRRKANNAGVEM
jgi:hypothetical protein